MIHFIILFSRQGKIRLQKWYEARTDQDKKKITRELTQVILARKPKMCNFSSNCFTSTELCSNYLRICTVDEK